LILAGDDKTIRVWSVSSDERKAGLVRTFRGQIDDGRAGEVFAAALSYYISAGVNNGSSYRFFLAGPPGSRNTVHMHDFLRVEVQALLQ
jgi:predicted dehydrogenase